MNIDHKIFLMLIIHVVHGICREGCAPVITLSCATGAPLSLSYTVQSSIVFLQCKVIFYHLICTASTLHPPIQCIALVVQ